MIESIRIYIEQHKLLTTGKPVLVGLSGGADSVALLAVLVRLGYACIALHCNFHLRGEESDRDEAFAEAFAGKLDVPFHKADFDTSGYAAAKHISIEMAARELRYDWFEKMRRQTGAQAIAVAHHRDDNVETVLLNLIRGTGIKGIRGMRPRNNHIVRPLLAVGKEDILAWLGKEHILYVTDSTNLSDEYTRNFIRLRVIPLLREINPSVQETIAGTAAYMADVENIVRWVVKQAKTEVMKGDGRLSIPGLLAYPAPQTILYELLLPYGFSGPVCTDIFSSLAKEPGKTFYSATHRIIKDREYLLITPNETGQGEPPLLSTEIIDTGKGFELVKDKNIAYFDYDKLRLPLSIRRWKAGDWFVPFGMKGHKKLSDYFSDNKYSIPDKEQAWLLCSGEDIIWLIGERTDNRYRVEKTTKRALMMKISVEKSDI